MNWMRRPPSFGPQSRSGPLSRRRINASAVTLRRLGNDAAALAEFEAAVRADGNDPEAWYHLGLARKSQGKITEAIEAFRQPLRLKPDFEKAHYNLGIALRVAGRQQAAQEEADRD